MLPTLFTAAGLILLGCGLWLVRSLGSGYRIGRTLAAAPLVPVTTAIAMARQGQAGYVRVHGRIASDEEFPDEHDRPLVFRRRRLEIAVRGRWRPVLDDREAVSFGVEERAAYIAIDAAQLGAGLVVLPRESTGLAAEAAEHLPPGTDPTTPTRLRIDQVSAVEQADVAGQPIVGADGAVCMTAGVGRPLILSTLEQGAAMRVLGAGHVGRLRLAAACLAAGGLSLLLAILVALMPVGVAIAASPTGSSQPSAAGSAPASPVPSPVDTRSSGVGPGLVGQPFLAALGVVIVAGLGLMVATALSRTRGSDGDAD
ncbi:MAG: hypothetical protein ACHQZR_06605 [Candidatus Limnocylindrales bacterium]